MSQESASRYPKSVAGPPSQYAWRNILILSIVAVLIDFDCLMAQESSATKSTQVADTSRSKNVRDSWPRFLGPNFDSVVQSEQPFDWTKKPKLLWQLAVGDGYGIGTVDSDNHYYHFDAPGERPNDFARSI